jgi:Zn-dependent peptidase ImmA (M78 family)
MQSLRNFGHIGNHSLNSIASTFDFGHQLGHLVAKKGVITAANVQTHSCVLFLKIDSEKF